MKKKIKYTDIWTKVLWEYWIKHQLAKRREQKSGWWCDWVTSKDKK